MRGAGSRTKSCTFGMAGSFLCALRFNFRRVLIINLYRKMSQKYFAQLRQTLVGNENQQERLQGHMVVAVIPLVGLAWCADKGKEHCWRDEGSELVDWTVQGGSGEVREESVALAVCYTLVWASILHSHHIE